MEAFNETAVNSWLVTLTQPSKKQILESLNTNWKACLQSNFSFDAGDTKFINSISNIEAAKITSTISSAVQAINDKKRVIIHITFTKTRAVNGAETHETPIVHIVHTPISVGNHPEIAPIIVFGIVVAIGIIGEQAGCWEGPL